MQQKGTGARQSLFNFLSNSTYGRRALDAALDGALERDGDVLLICDARDVPTLERDGDDMRLDWAFDTDGLLSRLLELDDREGETDRPDCERDVDGLLKRGLGCEERDGEIVVDRLDDERDGETSYDRLLDERNGEDS